ncbi:MAG: hypothetical protein QOH13_1568, partial [Thermoleophilaceae bacterium]|nr:hypothetical protein [Thermoleophilaceae bacterium]
MPAACAVLLAAFPLLSLFAQNQSEVEISLLWWPLGLTVLGTLGLYGILWLITRRAARAGALASLSAVAFFYYGLSNWPVVLWLALLALGIAAIARTRHDLANLTLVLGAFAAVVTVPQIADIWAYHANHPSLSASDPRLRPTALAQPSIPKGARPPDIFVIIPDDYARADVLARYFHYDDGPFLRELERRGFRISAQSRSPYSDSESNTAAALNLDYLSRFPRVLGAKSEDVRPVKRVTEDNRASRLLEAAGYDYIHLDTDEVTFAGGNPRISALAPPDSFANLWMQKSILSLIGGPLGFDQSAQNARFRDSITSQFAQLGRQAEAPRPKFVVFHTLLPHDPYIFDAAGRAVTFPGHGDEDLASAQGRAYYLQQLEMLNRKLLTAIDQIRAHAKTPPVIVIQSDEGFQANPTPFGEKAMLDIRVKGLSAFSLPGRDNVGLPSPPNTVNGLRFVFNQYLGTHYEMLRSASYPEGDYP